MTADRQTHRQTETLIAILRCTIGEGGRSNYILCCRRAESRVVGADERRRQLIELLRLDDEPAAAAAGHRHRITARPRRHRHVLLLHRNTQASDHPAAEL